MPIDRDPVSTKPNWKPSLKFVNSMEHSLKGYADDVTLLSSDIDVHKSVLQSLYISDGSKLLLQGISLSMGST